MQPVGGIFERGRFAFRLAWAGHTLACHLRYLDPFLAWFGNNQRIAPLLSTAKIDRVTMIMGTDPGVVRGNFDYTRVIAPGFFAQIDAITGVERCGF